MKRANGVVRVGSKFWFGAVFGAVACSYVVRDSKLFKSTLLMVVFCKSNSTPCMEAKRHRLVNNVSDDHLF
jgi:hypothetical protein